jgi:small ligand-binding sensory domain FIST
VLLFARPDALTPADLASVRLAAPGACVLGAGTAGPSPVVVAGAEVSEAPIAGLCLSGGASPIVEAAPACRLLGEFVTIDEATSRGMVLTIGGRPALDALRAAASEAVAGDTQPLVLAALESEDDPGDPPRFALRPLRGVDVDNKGVLVGPDARQGRRLAFAVRDPKASRALLGDAVRRLSEATGGSAADFALLLSCAGRGQGLYGAPDVDVKIVRERFPGVPIAGMHSSFEISPAPRGGAELMLYTAVVALFRSPS